MTAPIETKDLIDGKHKLSSLPGTNAFAECRGRNLTGAASNFASILECYIEMISFILRLLMRECRTVANWLQSNLADHRHVWRVGGIMWAKHNFHV
jgi:hypothetical protein